MNNASVMISTNKELVKTIREALKNNDGYCPCMTTKNEDTKCICRDFREMEEDGECHCGLYVKMKL